MPTDKSAKEAVSSKRVYQDYIIKEMEKLPLERIKEILDFTRFVKIQEETNWRVEFDQILDRMRTKGKELEITEEDIQVEIDAVRRGE